MNRIIPLFFILVNLFCGSTIEFIPDTDFNSRNFHYTKTSYKEVEILFTKPILPIRTQGIVIFRSFSENGSLGQIQTEIQKELFERKIDGVWFDPNVLREEGVPIIVRSENQQGVIVSFNEASTEINKRKGIAFRYMENGKRTPNLR